MKLVAVAGVALLSFACSSAGQLTADVNDYAAYRRVRVASTRELRLTRAWAYLEAEPSGRFRAEVLAWFMPAEATFFESAGTRRERLRRYLELLPNGPHASEARERLRELEAVAERRREHEEEVVGEALTVTRRLARAERRRRAFVEEFSGWVARLGALRSFGERTSALSGEFLYALREVEPPARCDTERCVKTVTLGYMIPEAGRLAPREAVFDVVVSLRDGGVSRVTLRGPELFSRVGEALELRPASESDPGARAEAMGRAADLVRSAVEAALPAARCARAALAPAMVVRECDGVRLTMVAGGAGEDDQLIAEPLE